MRRFPALLATCLLACGAAAAAELSFAVDDGRVRNAFFRDGPTAAHVVLKSGADARLVVAFPAGDSGVGLWFDAAPTFGPVEGVVAAADATRGDARRGVAFATSVDGRTLTVKRAVLGSVRVLRDYCYTGAVPSAVETTPTVSGATAMWDRRRLDGAPGYLLAVTAVGGAAAIMDGAVRFRAGGGERLRLRIEALTGDPPLSGIPENALVTSAAGGDPRLRQILAFLSYDEKLLAGSWRFDTYFGRDTLMSVALLMPALSPRAIEAGLGAVLERLDDAGAVAHEEEVGEYALLSRRRRGEPPSDEPVLDYKMIDDDFMLAPVVARYLLDTDEGRARATAFLTRRTADGELYGARLARNIAFVASRARPFAKEPRFRHLIALQSDGPPVGDWRDSAAGLGFGRYPYDVNAALVPAALDAAARLVRSGLLAGESAADLDWREIEASGAVWRKRAPSFFVVRVSAAEARVAVARYAGRAGVEVAPAENRSGGFAFDALSLDHNGRPVPVLHSDVGYSLFFGAPPAKALERMIDAPLRPFPAGLMTGVGMLVANPAFAPDALQTVFGRDRYHGTVVWSWQQALYAAGLERQIARRELPERTRAKLRAARAALWRAVRAGADVQGSELWSWSFADGVYAVERFGQRGGDETESNAAQLWSTVYLGVSCGDCPPP